MMKESVYLLLKFMTNSRLKSKTITLFDTKMAKINDKMIQDDENQMMLYFWPKWLNKCSGQAHLREYFSAPYTAEKS